MPFIADKQHNLKYIVFNFGVHYNPLQMGGGLSLDVISEIYHTVVDYISDTLASVLRDDQIAFFRSCTSGHSNGKGVCASSTPLTELVRIKYFDWAWHLQETYNAIWHTHLETAHLRGELRNVLYLDVYRPSMLAAHAHKEPPGDCLHFCLTGGVVQNWSRILWDVITSIRRTVQQ